MRIFRMVTLSVLCGILPSLAVFAASAHKASVVNVNGLMKPGLWKSVQTDIQHGKPGKGESSKDCITAADLRDFLNNSQAVGTLNIGTYKLEGNRLHVKSDMSDAGKKVGTIEETVVFDSPTTMHGVFKLTMTSGGKPETDITKIESHRIGDCKGGAANR
ncbi:MAG: DUF3617 domain-containing protein [Gammaproteobacteria bacterium]